MRLSFYFAVAWIGLLAGGAALHAQVVPYLVPSSAPSSTEITSIPSGSDAASPIDFALFSWRIGQLSPAVYAPLTSSVASTAAPAPPGIPDARDPFIASTISMQGGLTTHFEPAAASTPVSSATAQNASFSQFVFAPSFFRLSSSVPDNIIAPTVNDAPPAEQPLALFALNQYAAAVSDAPGVTVPEPGTIALCVGTALVAGYVWMRRQNKETEKENQEQQAILLGQTSECLSK